MYAHFWPVAAIVVGPVSIKDILVLCPSVLFFYKKS